MKKKNFWNQALMQIYYFSLVAATTTTAIKITIKPIDSYQKFY